MIVTFFILVEKISDSSHRSAKSSGFCRRQKATTSKINCKITVDKYIKSKSCMATPDGAAFFHAH